MLHVAYIGCKAFKKMTIIDKEIQADYQNRVNRVIDFIDENIDSDLSLNTISEIAYFSPFHFHRIFKFLTGEYSS